MSYIYGKRFSHPLDPLTAALREELYVGGPGGGYAGVDWNKSRSLCAKEDLYYPHPLIQDVVWWTVRERGGGAESLPSSQLCPRIPCTPVYLPPPKDLLLVGGADWVVYALKVKAGAAATVQWRFPASGNSTIGRIT